jgi:hypothetical protein
VLVCFFVGLLRMEEDGDRVRDVFFYVLIGCLG